MQLLPFFLSMGFAYASIRIPWPYPKASLESEVTGRILCYFVSMEWLFVALFVPIGG